MSDYEEDEGEDVWDAEQLAAACDSLQDWWRRGIPLRDDDPRQHYIGIRIAAGVYLMDDVLLGGQGRDAASVVETIDALPIGALKVLAFERCWREGVRREAGGTEPS